MQIITNQFDSEWGRGRRSDPRVTNREPQHQRSASFLHTQGHDHRDDSLKRSEEKPKSSIMNGLHIGGQIVRTSCTTSHLDRITSPKFSNTFTIFRSERDNGQRGIAVNTCSVDHQLTHTPGRTDGARDRAAFGRLDGSGEHLRATRRDRPRPTHGFKLTSVRRSISTRSESAPSRRHRNTPSAWRALRPDYAAGPWGHINAG